VLSGYSCKLKAKQERDNRKNTVNRRAKSGIREMILENVRSVRKGEKYVWQRYVLSLKKSKE